MTGTTDDTPEERRLRALHDLDILDTPPEEEFDRIVRLAAALCDAPLAAINLTRPGGPDRRRRHGVARFRDPSSVSYAVDHCVLAGL